LTQTRITERRVMLWQYSSDRRVEDTAEQDHWTERGRPR
jgi:hypothetical protein